MHWEQGLILDRDRTVSRNSLQLVFISSRLRKYTIGANNSLTLPAYWLRFRDKKRVLLLVSSIVIVIFSWYIQRLHCLPVENYLTLYSVWIIMWLWPSVLRLF